MSEWQLCFDESVAALMAFHLPSTNCMKYMINWGLGMAILCGAPFTKLAQIAKIVQNKSTVGLALSSFFMETVMFYSSWGFNSALNLPFTSYGEAAILAVEVFFLVLCMFYYGKGGIQIISIQPVYVAVVVATTVGILNKSIPLDIWRPIYSLQVPVVMASRIPQIITLAREKKAGVLSFIAVLLNFLGTLIRSLTSFLVWQKSGFGSDEAWIFGNFMVSFSLNAVIVAQWIYYGEDGHGYLCMRRKGGKAAARKKKQ